MSRLRSEPRKRRSTPASFSLDATEVRQLAWRRAHDGLQGRMQKRDALHGREPLAGAEPLGEQPRVATELALLGRSELTLDERDLLGIPARGWQVRALGISPREYLTDALAKPEAGWPRTRLRELLPDAWAAAPSAPAFDQAA